MGSLPLPQHLQAQLSHRLWWLKLTALADLEDWEELEKISKSKKSPIGYLVSWGPSFHLLPGRAVQGEDWVWR